MNNPNNSNYNPDVLSCLANLSNDEVFTPPEVANAMLDLLPQEIFRNPNAKFLDPACKSGVFLREIAKRLIEGLKEKFPDLEERVNHIFTNQLYAIAITELTSLLSRRSVYCSKDAGGKYSVAHFEKSNGNIFYTPTKHVWKGEKCRFCGASKSEYGDKERAGLESHAYQFIHNAIPGEIEEMKFDVIIGNPPYQMGDGGASASAKPIYHLFIQQAKKLNPRYLVMIVPSRWFSGGKGLDTFRDEMIHDKRIRYLVDYFNPNDCFPGIDLKGGVCYFRWERDNQGECTIKNYLKDHNSEMKRTLEEKDSDIFIRFNEAIPIYRKVKTFNEKAFSEIVSSRKPFGFDTSFSRYTSMKKNTDDVKIYANKTVGFIAKEKIPVNQQWIDKSKVYITKAYGAGDEFPHQIINNPIAESSPSCCTETYIVVGPFDNSTITDNVISYMKTRFFRFLVLLHKNTQDATKIVYSFVPLQDFSKPWTDEELYKKYNLSPEEIAFIESMIRPME
jgi:site-specific DNA-methyltransferase (adenine-specific)